MNPCKIKKQDSILRETHFKSSGHRRPLLHPSRRLPARVRCSASDNKQQQRRAYPFDEIEPKWQQHWEVNKTFRTPEDVDTSKPKCYILDMFPYPRDSSKGYNSLKYWTVPISGFSYNWDRDISTTEPHYYKWTQWIFLPLLKKGLAYQAEVPVNWCPALSTVLANEEVVNGVSERGGHPVIRKPMRQWMLKITAYADRLLGDLDGLDWPESIKEMQRNWIGRSEGAELEFSVVDLLGHEEGVKLSVYTTRPDTIFGETYLVVAPEHYLLSSIVSDGQQKEVEEYREVAARKSELERTDLQKEKKKLEYLVVAKNPATGEVIPIWVADYVLGSGRSIQNQSWRNLFCYYPLMLLTWQRSFGFDWDIRDHWHMKTFQRRKAST
ncbi:uncharacterized protein A4U43_C01F28910 [Asparagus officinalis]|uniref:leucine--tRNA ligase n=1 Tax=Asparagus officinalis TaxID=4686 RepID=A0A5P1FWT3_ASPOF|nr:uncharacterized protein A4U43_C01F28910 [Asparagus officinalis]